MNLLFVCSRNQWRSPTAERVFSGRPGIAARSAGTASSAKHRVSHRDIQWADVVIAMEDKHLKRLRHEFPDEMKSIRACSVNIPDDYRYMDPELIEVLTESIEPIIQAET